MALFLDFNSAKQRRELLTRLATGITTITFQKDDGTRRTIRFTLDTSLAPAGTFRSENNIRSVFLYAYDVDARSIKTVRWGKIFQVEYAAAPVQRGRAVPVGQPDPSLSALNAVKATTPTRAEELALLADLTKIGFINGKPVTNAMLLGLTNLRVERETARLKKDLDYAVQAANEAQNLRRAVLTENERLKNQLVTAQNTIGRVRNLVN